MRVAVIGAGPAGLTATKQSIDAGFHVECFEQSDNIGGLWRYSEQEDYSKHSCMYDTMQTDVPIEIMSYPDFAWKKGADLAEKSFVGHAQVLAYLEDYSAHFNLKPKIHFNHTLTNLSFNNDSKTFQLSFTTNDNSDKTQKTVEKTFDSVMVCTGHFHKPNIPTIPNIEQFKNPAFHNKIYRRPEKYADKTIFIVGGSNSAIDMASDFSKLGCTVYVSHHESKPLFNNPQSKPANIHEVCDVDRVSAPTSLLLKDGSTIADIDAIIYATGYSYAFPFLQNSNIPLTNDNGRISPLYKHMIHMQCPRLAFIALCSKIVAIPFSYHQVKYFIQTLQNNLPTPTQQQYEKDIQNTLETLKKHNWPQRYFHRQSFLQLEYCKQLAQEANFNTLSKAVTDIYKDCGINTMNDITTYRNYYYNIIDDENFERHDLKKT